MEGRICPGCTIEKTSKFFQGKAVLCKMCTSSGVILPEPVVTEKAVDNITTEDVEAFPAVEVNYTDPTTQEIAARTLARRRLLPFIKRFRKKYDAGWVHEDICRRLERFMKDVEDEKEPRLILMMPVRHGKLLADSTPILTTRGWKTHGTLNTSDFVYGTDGKHTNVVGFSQPGVADVIVTMSNGAIIKCHENHEWTVYQRSHSTWMTVETKYWLDANRFGARRQLKSAGRYIYQLPAVAPIEHSQRFLPLHPYAFGAWLGDGSTGKTCITHHVAEREIIQAIADLGYAPSAVCVGATDSVVSTYFGSGIQNNRSKFSQGLKKTGALRSKHIPQNYMLSSVAQRLELLAGLIDTDGSVDKPTGRVRIVTVSDTLRNNIIELIRSLGMNAGCHTQAPCTSSSGIVGRRPTHYVSFTPTIAIPTRLPRKKILGKSREAVAIVSVERTVDLEHGRCIQVARKDGLYLAGTHLTPTHNSEIASRHFAPFVLGHHPDWEIIAASAAQNLALTFSRYIRDLMRDPSYHALFPNAVLDPSSQSVENWNLTSGGGYMAAGIGTMITGRGAHILLIDDPVADAEAADSFAQREKTWEWYISTALSRLAPGGGVLGIMCMTGDTPVLMATGVEQRLDTLVAGDKIATYANGTLISSAVAAIKACGCDPVLRIITKSGKSVKANARHPFLTVSASGELAWTRTKNLTTAMKIVTVRDSGESGPEWSVSPRNTTKLPSVADYVRATTLKSGGLMGTVANLTGRKPAEIPDSNIATELRQLITTLCTKLRKNVVPFVKNTQKPQTHPHIGNTSSLSTIVTTQEKSGDCCATTVTQESDILALSAWHLPPQNISDFTCDEIISIESDGIEEVYDVQVDHTENFIANGLVSHNTWWHEDDWAGRVQESMKLGEGDMFEIVRYPAINTSGDEYILADDTIVELPPSSRVPEGARLTRVMNSALHGARYTYEALLKRKATYYALGQKRWWAALYQQDPTPEEGMHFTKKMIREYSHVPQLLGANIYQAWDFAITVGEQNDYTVGITVLHDGRDDIYVLDVKRFRSGDGDEIMNIIVDYAAEYSANTIGVEDGQIWKSLQTTFARVCSEKKYYPSYEVLKPLTDKLVRAQPLRGRMQAGKVYFPKNAPWMPVLTNEILKFPGGKHDDQVDALAWAIRLILMKSPPILKQPAPLLSWKDKLKGMLSGQGGGGHMSS